jgi:hypothetical protein
MARSRGSFPGNSWVVSHHDWAMERASGPLRHAIMDKECCMRSLKLVFFGLAAVGMSAGALAQNAPTQNPPTQPATQAGSKPAGQLGNSGGGLSMGMTPREAQMAFGNMDANHDGFLDRSEFMHNGDSGQRFAGCDVNRDGKLSEAEYVQCSQRPATQDQGSGQP